MHCADSAAFGTFAVILTAKNLRTLGNSY